MTVVSKREFSRQDRRRRILWAARHLVEQHGATGLSMRSLAKAADISAVTVYSIFGSKAGVLSAIVEEDRAKFAMMMKAGVGHDIESLFRLLALACDFYREDEQFYRAIFEQYFSAGGVEIRGILDPGRHALWRGIVDGMTDNGLFVVAIDADLFTSQLENIFLAAHLRWSTGQPGIDRLHNEIGLGFAMLIKAIAGPEHQDLLRRRILDFSSNLVTTPPSASADSGAISALSPK